MQSVFEELKDNFWNQHAGQEQKTVCEVLCMFWCRPLLQARDLREPLAISGSTSTIIHCFKSHICFLTTLRMGQNLREIYSSQLLFPLQQFCEARTSCLVAMGKKRKVWPITLCWDVTVGQCCLVCFLYLWHHPDFSNRSHLMFYFLEKQFECSPFPIYGLE